MTATRTRDTPRAQPRSHATIHARRSDLTLDGGAAALSRNLSVAVRRQLDSGWHTLPWGTRQRVTDLATVQALAGLLLETDAVTFLG
jgi:hypothetical protein